MNIVLIRGVLARPVELRDLRSGDLVADFEVTTPGVSPSYVADSVPCVWFSPPAWIADMKPDTGLLVLGRVRRRFFRASGFTQSRTEVVVTTVTRADDKAGVARVSAEVLDMIDTMNAPAAR